MVGVNLVVSSKVALYEETDGEAEIDDEGNTMKTDKIMRQLLFKM